MNDLEERDPNFFHGVAKFLGGIAHPIVKGVGSAVMGALTGKRELELDSSDIDNRDFDIDELEERVPQGGWDKFNQVASAVPRRPVTVNLASGTPSGSSKKRSLELDDPELYERELDLFNEVPVLGARTSDGFPELDVRQRRRLSGLSEELKRRVRMRPTRSQVTDQGPQSAY
ncbi:hypothetical protein H1R20_g10836, partial [Candolleomyces eurysporus]